MKIIVDVDGVLANLIPVVVAWVNDTYHTRFRPSFVREWDQAFPCTRMDVGKVVAEIMVRDDLVLKIRSIKHSRWGMAMLAVEHDITIATARPLSATGATLRWLRKRSIHYDQFSGCVERSKADLEGDVLIDDKWENCQEFAATGRRAILFDQPWNRAVGQPGGQIVRARGWVGTTWAIRYMGGEHAAQQDQLV